MAAITVEEFRDICETLKAHGDTGKWRDAFGKWYIEYVAEEDNKRISLRDNDISEWLCFYIDHSVVNVFSEDDDRITTTGKAGNYKQFREILKKYEVLTVEEKKAWLNMLEGV